MGVPELRLADVQAVLRPDARLEGEIRAFLDRQLGRVLPRREFERYFEWVVLGRRALEALPIVLRYRPASERPLLDVGSGLGALVLLAASQGVSAVGVEPGDEELALARRRAEALGVAPDVFHAGAGEALPFEDASFSAAVMHDVLEHVADWRCVLAEAHRVLEPGGVLYVKGPSYAFLFVEPHYRVPWLPLLPRPLARRYLAALGRDTDYFAHVGYRRRGAVVRELRRLGFDLEFPRLRKLREPSLIKRPHVRRAVERLGRDGRPPRALELLAENPFQATIDVVARKPV